MQLYLFQNVWTAGFPCQDVPRWLEWASELGLKGRDLDSFTSFLDSLRRTPPSCSNRKRSTAFCIPTKDETSKSSFELWPNSGIVWDGVCLTAKTSESPNHASESSLWELIEKGEVPEKYFLSPNAAKGMLRRAKQMGRKLFPPLRRSVGDPVKGPVVKSLAHCLYACSARHTGTDWSRTYIAYPKTGGVRRPTPRECEGIMGFPAGMDCATRGAIQNTRFGHPPVRSVGKCGYTACRVLDRIAHQGLLGGE